MLMIIFHFCYDLIHFGYLQNIDLDVDLEWRIFRYIIISLFLFTVGVSLNLRHAHKIVISSFVKRSLLLVAASALISVVSFFQFPHSWIYFGIIHFIFVATLFGLLLRRLPNVCLVMAIAIFIGYAQGFLHLSWLYQILQPWWNLPRDSEDLVRFFPWFGVVLLGMYFAYYRFYDLSPNTTEDKLATTNSKSLKGLLFIGRHALLIYLIHQPILFAGFLSVELIF